MWRTLVVVALVAVSAGAAHSVFAQAPRMPAPAAPHGHHRHGSATGGVPGAAGQAAFAAIAEIVGMLSADPRTDWSKVDVERLRQHLIDMDEVIMRAAVKSSPAPGGLVMDVTGPGRTAQAIQAMVVPHAKELDRLAAYAATTEPIAGGVRLTVTAKDAGDARAVARVRGLGFAGLMTEGGHHAPHHLAMARGQAPGHAH